MDFPLKKHTCFYIYIYIDIRCWILSRCVVRLYQAARVGDEKLVEELIQKDANLEECGKDDKDGRFRIRFLIGSGGGHSSVNCYYFSATIRMEGFEMII